MRAFLQALLICMASSGAADCAWTDDGIMATALLNSQWQLTTAQGYRVDAVGKQTHVKLVPEIQKFSLSFDETLRHASVGRKTFDLTVADPSVATDGSLEVGRHSFVTRFPTLDGAPCETSDLSALHFTTNSDHWRMDTWLILRAYSETKLVGLIRIVGNRSANGVGAGLYAVEARPFP